MTIIIKEGCTQQHHQYIIKKRVEKLLLNSSPLHQITSTDRLHHRKFRIPDVQFYVSRQLHSRVLEVSLSSFVPVCVCSIVSEVIWTQYTTNVPWNARPKVCFSPYHPLSTLPFVFAFEMLLLSLKWNFSSPSVVSCYLLTHEDEHSFPELFSHRSDQRVVLTWLVVLHIVAPSEPSQRKYLEEATRVATESYHCWMDAKWDYTCVFEYEG